MTSVTLADVEFEHLAHSQWYRETNQSSPLPYGLSNWTYGTGSEADQHIPAIDPLPVIFMGFNPGGGNGATEPTMTASERSWRTKCSRLAREHPSQIVFTELISIPTKTQDDLAGYSLRELMSATLKLNKAIIGYHRPKVVFQAGLSSHHLTLTQELYGLTEIAQPIRKDAKGRALLRSFRTPDNIPWIVFKHFASPGFSNQDRNEIQKHAETLGWGGSPSWPPGN